MSKEPYDQRSLTRYLLGSVGGEEAERLDELSVTDDEFAHALDAAEKDLVDAYVRGELRGPALEQFEAHYLATPLRRERVRFARALQALAEKEEVMRAADARAKGPVGEDGKPRRRGWFLALGATARPAWRWGAAFAALALLAAGGWLALERVRLRRPAPQAQAPRQGPGRLEQETPKEARQERGGQPTGGAGTERELTVVGAERDRPAPERQQERRRNPAGQRQAGRPAAPAGASVASFILEPQVRGEGQIAEVSVPPGTAGVAVRLELEPNEFSVYRVELLEPPGERPLWRRGRLGARDAGGGGRALLVRFPAALLQPRRTYVLRVTGLPARGPGELVGDYGLKVVK